MVAISQNLIHRFEFSVELKILNSDNEANEHNFQQGAVVLIKCSP